MADRSSSISVFLRLHGQRQFSKELAASGAELEALGLKGAKAMTTFAAKADSLKKFGKSWTHNVSLPVAGLSVIAGGMAMNFKRQMGLVATDAGGTAKEVEHLEKSVLGLSRESQYGPQQLAESLFHVESSGYRGAKAMKVLNEAQKLATTGNSDLQTTTYALVSATKSLYGESLTNVNRTAAELNGIVAHGDMRLEELTAAMATGVIPKAKAVGLNLRDVGAAMDVMTARGIPAQRAAYALGFTMQKLIPATEKAEDAFASIGLGQETLLKASQNGKYGYVSGLEVLQKHLDRLPTQGQQNKVIQEMFGGGRMTSGLLTDLQNLGEMKKIYGELGNEVKIYTKHTKEAEDQPLVKLKAAWSGIQASLVEIGDELVPIAGPLLEKVATDGEKISHAFLALPGPVKAATLAFLVLTGPVASGLGYFASGIGRALILTSKLARAGKDVSIFTSALQSGQGLKGSAGMAFGGLGQSGAVQTAKGFAYSLGPAVASYGIGNIITSATSGDWQDAGFEAGGAMAGGIAGFMLGGPMGAMLGVGLGSLGGELLSGLFKSGKGLPNLQERIASSSKGLKTALEQEHQAAEGLARSGKNLVDARHHQKTAAQGLKRAEHALEVARANAPAGSRAIAKAEVRVAKSIERVTRAKKAAKRAERKKGGERAIAKESLRYATLEERHRKSLLKERIRELRLQKHSVAAHAAEGEKLQKLRPINEALIKNMGRLHTVNKQANETQKEAAEQIGPRYAGFLRKASREALNLGSKLKVAALRQREFNEESEAYIQARREGFKTIGEAEFWREGAVGSIFGEGPAGGQKTPKNPGHRPRRHHTSARAGASSLPTPRHLSLKSGALAGVVHVHVQNDNTLLLDGKVLAENTTRESRRAAALQ